MSNRSLKSRIKNTVESFKIGQIGINALKSSIQDNGRALEMMPYVLIKEIDDIEHKLTLAQFAEEEDCTVTIDDVLFKIDEWLSKVPEETN